MRRWSNYFHGRTFIPLYGVCVCEWKSITGPDMRRKTGPATCKSRGANLFTTLIPGVLLLAYLGARRQYTQAIKPPACADYTRDGPWLMERRKICDACPNWMLPWDYQAALFWRGACHIYCACLRNRVALKRRN